MATHTRNDVTTTVSSVSVTSPLPPHTKYRDSSAALANSPRRVTVLFTAACASHGSRSGVQLNEAGYLSQHVLLAAAHPASTR